MSYIFGPVNSRRLGLSLGIDLIPFKTCSYDCIYCECGPTTFLTDNVKNYVNTDDVIKELELFIKSGKKTDFFTFAGSGEPTLASNIKDVINYLISKVNNKNIVILTNGSLFYRDHVIDNISKANIIIPSLDAATEETFKKINRPLENIVFKDVIRGLIDLRNHYKGFIALEIFIIDGVNTSVEELTLFKKHIAKILPDEIQLNILDRPGVYKNIKKPSYEKLKYIKDFLGHKNTVIVSRNYKDYEIFEGISGDIIEAIKRRPLTISDIKMMTGFSEEKINNILTHIKDNYDLIENTLDGKKFFKIKV